MILIIGASLFLLDYYLNSMIMADAHKHNFTANAPWLVGLLSILIGI